jgi:hypothetical protein
MKYDITRDTFRKSMHYRMVNMQQGRVQVDADWNEQNKIQFHYEKEYLKDLIGKSGTLAKDNGFAISPSGSEFLIGPGHYYVDGILCENEKAVEYSKQPDVLQQSTFVTAPYLVYLDVWERHITHLDDPYIREQALGNVDTATRTKIVWQVRMLNASDLGSDRCNVWQNALQKIDQHTTGTMEARAKPSPESQDRCSLYETAGYMRLENQLYRIEVHESGDLATAKFKWSRENGSVVSRITKYESEHPVVKLVIAKRGKDEQLDFKTGDWAEITDDLNELHGLPGSLAKLEVDDTTIICSNVIGKSIGEANYPLSRNPKIRRWESIGDNPLIDSDTPKDSEGYIELEYGVQVKLGNGYYRTGDYWLVPARTRQGKVEWPTGSNDKPIALGHAGIVHHYAPLALLEYNKNNKKFEEKWDVRSFFSSLTDLIAIQYAGGDGQQALPDNKLPAPLRVSVMLGRQPINETPMKGAKVKFTIIKQLSTSPGSLRPLPAGSASNQPIDVPINAEGIAECEWTLGDGMEVQQVKAELYDDCANAMALPPIYFNATLPLSFYYVEGDGVEVKANDTAALSAGVMLGKKAVSAGYKVKFEIMLGGGSLPAAPIALNPQGIATTTYSHSGQPRRQARARLLRDDGSEVNLPPIYFNVGEPKAASAYTGILVLEIPPSSYPLPIKYGPFNHNLPDLDVPPAVMLGYVEVEQKDRVEYTEDYFITSALPTKEMEDYFRSHVIQKRGIAQFKPVEITKSQFKVELWTNAAGPQAPSRPAGASGTAAGRTFTVATDKIAYAKGDAITVSGNTGATATGQLVLIQILNPNGAVYRAEQVAVNADRSYAYKFKIEGAQGVQGRYTVKATYRGTSREITFNFAEKGATLLLRWWAIPANEQDPQKGLPERPLPLPTIDFDGDEYFVGQPLGISVSDRIANRDPGAADTLEIRVSSTSDEVGLSKIAIERGPNSGIFDVTVKTSGEGSPDVLRVKVGDTVTAKYVYGPDASDIVIDTARIRPPVPVVGIDNPVRGTLVLAIDNLELAEDRVTAFVATDEAPEGIPVVLKRKTGTATFSTSLKLNATEGSITVGNRKVPLAGLRPGSNVKLIYKYGTGESESVKSETRIRG